MLFWDFSTFRVSHHPSPRPEQPPARSLASDSQTKCERGVARSLVQMKIIITAKCLEPRYTDRCCRTEQSQANKTTKIPIEKNLHLSTEVFVRLFDLFVHFVFGSCIHRSLFGSAQMLMCENS